MFTKKLLKVGLVGLFALNVLYADTVRITKKTANVRSGASTKNKIIGKAHRGDGYELIRTTGQWVKISFKGDYGWISKSLVNIEEDVDEVTSGEGCIASDYGVFAANAVCCLAGPVACAVCTGIDIGVEVFAGDIVVGVLCD